MTNSARPRRPLSLALRITLIVGLVMTALFTSFAVLVNRSMEMHFADQDFGEIEAVAESLDAALGPAPASEDAAALEQRLARAVAGHHGVFFSVRSRSGAVIYSSVPEGLDALARASPTADRLDRAALQVWHGDGQAYRGVMVRMRGESVLVAVSMASHLRYLSQLRQALIAGTALACLAAFAAAWLAVRWGHAPLRRIGATVRGITSEQLHVRLAADTVPIELDPLVAAFNDMLDQLQRSFMRLANFSADIAHELRTPVTNLTTQTQVVLTKARDTEAYREVLYSGLEELDRMSKMIGDMLFLAQADHRLSTAEMSEVDLGAEVLALFDYLEAWAEDLGLGLQLEGALTVAGDRLMLRRAISNLLTNALRYTPRGERITAQLSQQGDLAEIRVCNPGPVIDAQHLERLFDRFYRVDPSRHRAGEGAGLGLAIVRSIAEAHGGRVGVESADGVTCFWLQLPKSARLPEENCDSAPSHGPARGPGRRDAPTVQRLPSDRPT